MDEVDVRRLEEFVATMYDRSSTSTVNDARRTVCKEAKIILVNPTDPSIPEATYKTSTVPGWHGMGSNN